MTESHIVGCQVTMPNIISAIIHNNFFGSLFEVPSNVMEDICGHKCHKFASFPTIGGIGTSGTNSLTREGGAGVRGIGGGKGERRHRCTCAQVLHGLQGYMTRRWNSWGTGAGTGAGIGTYTGAGTGTAGVTGTEGKGTAAAGTYCCCCWPLHYITLHY